MGLTSGEADAKLPVGAVGRCWEPEGGSPHLGQAPLCLSPLLVQKEIDQL